MPPPPTLDPSTGPGTLGKLALGEFCQQSWQCTLVESEPVWAQMVVTAGPDLGDQPKRKTWGLQRYTGHHLPQNPSTAALAPRSHQLLSPLPTSFPQILTPSHHPQDSRFPTPGHLPINSKPQPAGSKNDFLSRVAADSLARLKTDILGRGRLRTYTSDL